MIQEKNYPVGWECPKCGRVYSPTTFMCVGCPSALMNPSQSKEDKKESADDLFSKENSTITKVKNDDPLYLRKMIFG